MICLFVVDFLDPTFLDFQVPRSPNSQISRFPDFQTPPDPDELLDPNLTPLPTHPGIKHAARSPCHDMLTFGKCFATIDIVSVLLLQLVQARQGEEGYLL